MYLQGQDVAEQLATVLTATSGPHTPISPKVRLQAGSGRRVSPVPAYQAVAGSAKVVEL